MQLLLLLALIIVAAKVAGSLAVRAGQPAVLGELLAGVLLGPTFLDVMGWSLFPSCELGVVVKDIAEIGVLFLMFLAGLETELEEVRRVGTAASAGALGGILLPFAAGTGISRTFGFPPGESVFIGTLLVATSVSITAQTLMELDRLRTKEGVTILGAAVIDDVLGIIVLSLVVALSRPGGSDAGLGLLVARMTAFLILAVVVGLVAFKPFAALVKRRVQASEAVFAFAIVVIFTYSWAAEALGGLAAITGAYIAGVLFARTGVRHFVQERLKIAAYGLFVPVFFVSIGLEADVRMLGGAVSLTLLLVVAAIVTKIVGAGGGALLGRFEPIEALRVGTGMVPRGEVALIIASVGLRAGVIGRDVFSMVIAVTLATTLVAPVMLRRAFRERRAERGG